MLESDIKRAEAEPLPEPVERAEAALARDPERHWTRNPLSILWRVAVAIIALIFIAWLILYITKGRFLKHTFERIVSTQTQREVKVAGDFQLYFNPINIKFLAEGLTITNPAWAKNHYLFSSKLIDSNIATIPLIFGTRRVNWLHVVDGDLNLEWDAKGERNTWTFGDGKGKPLDLPKIRRAIVAGTRVHYLAPQLKLLTNLGVDTIRARDTRFANAIRFSGTGSLRGEPFTVSGALMSPNETVAGGHNQLVLHGAAKDTQLDVSGTLAGPTDFEGADLKVQVRGYDMSKAFDLLGVAIPTTRAYRFNSHLTKTGEEWRFTGITGRFGDSDFAGKMTISMPQTRLKLDADLKSKVVDIVDIGPFLGYDPHKLDAQKTAVVSNEGGHPHVLPDAPLRIDAISTFDANVKYYVSRVRAQDFPISNIGLTLDLDHKLLKLSPLTFDMAGGHVTSDISINARVPAVVTDYDIRLSPTPMGKLLAKWGVDESGTTGTLKARIQMKGTGDTIRKSLATSNGRIAVIMPAGTFWTRNVQLAELDIGTFVQKMFEKKLKDPVQINCGLIAFTVRDGLAAADPILIDTKKNVIKAKGGFSFRDEALDLSIRADAKTFSLFSAQSPIGVQGWFAAPKIDVISPQLLTRAGVGVGLALVNPFAAIIAFIDPGDAKAAQCGPVLAGAHAAAQRTTKGEAVEKIGNGKSATPQAEPKKHKKFLGIF